MIINGISKQPVITFPTIHQPNFSNRTNVEGQVQSPFLCTFLGVLLFKKFSTEVNEGGSLKGFSNNP